MALRSVKSLLVATFSLFVVLFSTNSYAEHSPEEQGQKQTQVAGEQKEAAFEPTKLIMEHIMDAHEFHFFSQGTTHVTIPLPVIIYSPQRGWSVFSYGNFHHGQEAYNGYKSEEGKIVAVDAAGNAAETVKVYDLSLTRNVVQMFLALTLLVVLMVKVANKYQARGIKAAPTGFQNAIEPVITFVIDEVGKPNLGRKYEKYMPYLLTVFFFILINNLVGLIPGTANVTGNIAFTMVLALISFVVIMFSSNKHFWAHIFWPPGMPFFVKVILIPVELLSVFLIKPASLMIRLFANMVAGHIIITCFIMLIFIFGAMNKVAGWGFAPVSIAFTVFIYFIEILVAFIQSFIFTTLTALFIGQSFEGEHHEETVHI
ncbi:MAG: F0F1 ATP synthase subunit A [Sediminibacterium sp.]